MTSEVGIANLALSFLGDEATVTSIDPPEGSAQAEHCAIFYAIARDVLLEMNEGHWHFATRRAALVEVELETQQITTWAFAYAKPSNCLKIISILPPEAQDDTSAPPAQANVFGNPPLPNAEYQPQDYTLEILDDGTEIIYTNQEAATIRFVEEVTDTSKFPPLFVIALAWLLASMLAGPILKGDVAREEKKTCLAEFRLWYAKAENADAQQKKTRPKQSVPWIEGR
jgi:hypothetical protein